MTYKDKYEYWLKDDYFDCETKKELEDLDEKEIEDRFYKELFFGTAGLRGVMAAGTNRMNKYTIARATQGLANYLLRRYENEKKISVAIAYDSRYNSKDFAEATALVLNANGIKTYLFDKLQPTPLLSFAVRELKCHAGIVITSSHNPKEYNGYKVYTYDGGQIANPDDEYIAKFINYIDKYSDIKTMSLEEAKKQKLYNLLDEKLENRFIRQTSNYIFNKEFNKKHGKDIRIVYTALNGTGAKIMEKLLISNGFKDLHLVESQCKPNPEFPGIPYPNPEMRNVFDEAVCLAKKVDADLILATDPDADRLGVMTKNEVGEYVQLNGNVVGNLMIEYILSNLKKENRLPEDSLLLKSIVTSNLLMKIGEEYNIAAEEVLTGFKNFVARIREYEKTGEKTYLYGFEESIGYMYGDYARDKNSFPVALLLAEITLLQKTEKHTLNDYINKLGKKYGYYVQKSYSFKYEGLIGEQRITDMMNNLRTNSILSINDIDVLERIDYLKQPDERLHSNVLKYMLADGSWFAIRPSGTEPKIKVYIEVCDEDKDCANNKLESLSVEVVKLLK